MAPYDKSRKRSWWNEAVAKSTPETVENLYRKRFDISDKSVIATAGSCFAQHIARNMSVRGYHIFDGEPAPFGLSEGAARQNGYGVYSCRYGDIYHVRQLRQLVREALSNKMRDDIVWERKGRYFDCLRPNIEPKGYDSAEEVIESRRQHLLAVRRMLREADVFIFTLGLTEAWINSKTGVVYPVFPGAFGQFAPELHSFRNFRVSEIVADFVDVRAMVQRVNPDLRYILTVSPVPLIATATESHVLTATTASKSILRAAAQELFDQFPDVDYFPSYEIISSPWSKGRFFEDDLRGITEIGVNTVMRSFFLQHKTLRHGETVADSFQEEELICDEILLQAFQK